MAHVIDHLRKGECDHDEIDAARAQAQRADDERVERRGRDCDRPLYEPCVDAFFRQDADGIAADAEIRGVAEAHHAAITHDEVEADRADREDQDPGEERQHESIAGQHRIDREQRDDRQQCDGECGCADKARIRAQH
jgi:hypothetical protein